MLYNVARYLDRIDKKKAALILVGVLLLSILFATALPFPPLRFICAFIAAIAGFVGGFALAALLAEREAVKR